MKVVSKIGTLGRQIWEGAPGTRLVAGAVAIGVAWACTTPGPADDGHDPLRTAIAASVATNVVSPTMLAFDDAAVDLSVAAMAWASTVNAGEPVDAQQTSRDAAREAWRSAMLVWQQAEVMQLGPAGSTSRSVGGEDLRDEVYSWPTVNPCRVDQELVAEAYAGEAFFRDSLVTVRGLDAVEYLLFIDAPGNACDASDPINANGSWDALGPDEVTRRRSAYAAAAALHVAEQGTTLADAWEPGVGEAALALSTPGRNGSVYKSPAAALDEIVAAILYIDTVVKDRKLDATTPDGVESPWAHRSKEHVVANLQAVRAMLLGGATPEAGTGFDDFLRALGEDAVADDLIAAVDRALAAVQAIDVPYAEAIAIDANALATAQQAVSELDDLIKGPLVTALNLSPPSEGAGDAD